MMVVYSVVYYSTLLLKSLPAHSVSTDIGRVFESMCSVFISTDAYVLYRSTTIYFFQCLSYSTCHILHFLLSA